MPGQKPRCTATRRDGSPCRAFAIHGTDPPLCWSHVDGDLRKRLAAERLKPENVLREQLRIVTRTKKVDPIDRAKLVVQIVSLLEKYKPRETNREGDREMTPAEKVAALRKKRV
jgi:hypothetical protein